MGVCVCVCVTMYELASMIQLLLGSYGSWDRFLFTNAHSKMNHTHKYTHNVKFISNVAQCLDKANLLVSRDCTM